MGLFDDTTETSGTSIYRYTPGNYQDESQWFTNQIAQRNFDKSEMLWDRYADTYAPYENAIIEANQKLIEPNADLQLASIDSQKQLLGASTKFTLANIQSQTNLLPFREESTKNALQLSTQQSQEKRADLTASRGVRDKFFQEAGVGAEALSERRAGQAAAGVEGAFGGAERDIRRQMSQFGIDPSSGSFKSAMRKVATDKARAKSGATTAARERAEQESFSRLSAGMNARQGGFGAQAIGAEKRFDSNLQKTSVPGGPGFQAPLGASQGFGADAGEAAGRLVNTRTGAEGATTGKTTTDETGTAVGNIAGNIVGALI